MNPGPGPWYGHGHHFHEGLSWGGWLVRVLFIIALLALVTMAIVWLVRSFTNHGPATAQRGMQMRGGPQVWGAGGTASAEQILAERFAHGQIDENEYQARLGVLRGERPMTAQAAPPPPAPAPPPAPPAPPTPPEQSAPPE
jgi:putative membrane protein